MRLMSMMTAGLAKRSFIMGMRVIPPERILQSSPYVFASDKASSSEFGAKYSKRGGYMRPPCGTCRDTEPELACTRGVQVGMGMGGERLLSTRRRTPLTAAHDHA